jgi:YfiH family protein
MHQVHGTEVRTVSDGSADTTGTDGIVTSTAGLGLAVLVADCVPLLAADPASGVIGAAHAGRKGSAAGIDRQLLSTMVAAGADVARIEVLVGPAICGACYEVAAEMRDEVEALLPGSATTTDNGTPGIDLRAGLVRRLWAAGVAGVEVDPRCTYTDAALYSHRRGAPTGRQAGLIWLDTGPADRHP